MTHYQVSPGLIQRELNIKKMSNACASLRTYKVPVVSRKMIVIISEICKIKVLKL